nr:hypothetical protein [Tanacetum cinerariifolium]
QLWSKNYYTNFDDQSEADDNDDDQEDEDEQDDNDQDDNDDDQDSDNDGDDFVHPNNDDESHGMNVRGDEEPDAEDDDEELYRDVNINLEGNDSLFELTPRVDVSVTTIVVPLLVTAPTLPSPSIPIMSQVQQAPAPTPTTAPSSSLRDLLKFISLFGFGYRLKTLEDVAMMRIKMKNPPLDQTGGLREEEKEKRQSQQVLQMKRPRRPPVSLLKGPNLIKRLHASLHQQRSQCRLQTKPPTPDRTWNKTLPATHKSIQPWISDLAKQADSRTLFNELMDTPVDFSAFLINRLKVDTPTPELLAGPTYELMKGSCKSLVELECFLEEVYKATTNQLDWNNPEGQQYPHNLLNPLPLIPNSRGRRVIPSNHFINNDLEYLRGGASS